MPKPKNSILNDVLAALLVGAVFLALGFIIQVSMPFLVIYPVAAFVIHLAARWYWRR